MSDERTYPQRPYLAVSAAIIRDGKVLVVRRARKPALGIYTLPGGGVETGETLMQAVTREVREETSLEIEPVALAGHREAMVRDAHDRGPDRDRRVRGRYPFAQNLPPFIPAQAGIQGYTRCVRSFCTGSPLS